LLFHVRFIVLVAPDGRKTETCAVEVVAPVIVFEKMLFLTSIPVRVFEVIPKAAESWLFVPPIMAPNRFTEL